METLICLARRGEMSLNQGHNLFHHSRLFSVLEVMDQLLQRRIIDPDGSRPVKSKISLAAQTALKLFMWILIRYFRRKSASVAKRVLDENNTVSARITQERPVIPPIDATINTYTGIKRVEKFCK